MPIQIGKSRAPTGPDEMLLDCHQRIRSSTAIARRLGAAAAGTPAKEISEAAHLVRKYFSESLPRHVTDENESILPRLMGKDPELDEALAAMKAEQQAVVDEMRARRG